MSDMTRRRRINVESLHNNKLWENSMDLELHYQTANWMLMENSKLKVKSVIDVVKANINWIRYVLPLMQSVTNMERKDILQQSVKRARDFLCSSRSAHVVETSNSVSTSQTEPDYYTECGQPIYVQSHMLQTMSTNLQKILEKSKLMLEFPIRLHYKDIDQKILLKVDTGSDINCVSLGTFQRLFLNKQLNRSILLLENYANSPVSIIGKFTAFIRWKGKVFHVTNANSLPYLLSRDACFRIEVLQTCFMFTGKEPVSNLSTNPHQKMEECIPLIQHSIDQESVRKPPLTKQKILDVYADVFEGQGTFPGEPYRFKLKNNYMPARHAPRKVPIHLQDDFYEEIHDLVKQGVLEKVEHSTEWVNSFVIVEKDVSMDIGNAHTPHHQFKKKL